MSLDFSTDMQQLILRIFMQQYIMYINALYVVRCIKYVCEQKINDKTQTDVAMNDYNGLLFIPTLLP